MSLSRRSFLKSSGLLASGLALGSSPFLQSCNTNRGISTFGLQLWTLRHVIVDDPKGVLQKVAEFGYKQIESYDGPEGMFWGMGNRGFKRFLDDHGMTALSSHANVFDDYERKVEQAAEIGIKYIICPHIGAQDTLDDYRKMGDTFNDLGRIANNAGIKFAYHNHAYTFRPLDGEMPQDVLMQHTDPDLVDYQMDIYWVEIVGEDSKEWLSRYPGRFSSSHVKDLTNGDNPESTILGTGTIDFSSILRVAKDTGMKHFIVEQEAYTGTTPLDAIRENADYMRELEL